MTTTPKPAPPIHCIPCRVTIDGNRWRIYSDGSVIATVSLKDAAAFGLKTVGDLVAYENKLPRLDPHSIEAKTICREASRLRRNRKARERSQAMRDLGMKKTPYGWE